MSRSEPADLRQKGVSIGTGGFAPKGASIGTGGFAPKSLGGSSAKGIDAVSAAAALSESIEELDTTAEMGAWSQIGTMRDPRDGLVKGYGLVIGYAMYAVAGSDITTQYKNTTEGVHLPGESGN